MAENIDDQNHKKGRELTPGERYDPTVQRRIKLPAGRKRGSKNRKTIVREVALEQTVIREKGKSVKLTAIELVLRKLENCAMEGSNQRAIKEYDRLQTKYDPEEIQGISGGVMLAPAEMSEEEWMALAEEDNKTAQPPPGYDWPEDDFDESD